MHPFPYKKISKRNSILFLIFTCSLFFGFPLFLIASGLWNITECSKSLEIPIWLMTLGVLIILERILYCKRLFNEMKFEEKVPKPLVDVDQISAWERERIESTGKAVVYLTTFLRYLIVITILIGAYVSFEVVFHSRENEDCQIIWSVFGYTVFALSLLILAFIGVVYNRFVRGLYSYEDVTVAAWSQMNLKLKQLLRLVENSFPEINNFHDKIQVDLVKQEDVKSFWSEIYFAKLTVKEGYEKEVLELKLKIQIPETVFVKIPRLSENLFRSEQKKRIDEDVLYNIMVYYNKKENLFYHHFPYNSIPNFPVPKVYNFEDITTEATGGLVAENLAEKVYAVEHVPGLNHEKVMRLMEALAGLHAHLLRREDKRYVESFKEGANGREFMTPRMHAVMFQEAKSFETLDPEVFGNVRIENLKWAFDYDSKNKAMEHCIKAIPGILVHADMNVTNLLWTNNSDDIAAIIDFQMVIIGSVAHDIIRILTLTLPREQRRQGTQGYLRHYYETLVGFFDGEEKAPFSWEELENQYSVIFPVSSNFTLFGIAIYVKMYKDGVLGTPESRDSDCKELIDRAKGIVEDIEALKDLYLQIANS